MRGSRLGAFADYANPSDEGFRVILLAGRAFLHEIGALYLRAKRTPNVKPARDAIRRCHFYIDSQSVLAAMSARHVVRREVQP